MSVSTVEARLNLGLARAKQGLKREAPEQFEQVLQRQATDQMALDQIKALRESPGVK